MTCVADRRGGRGQRLRQLHVARRVAGGRVDRHQAAVEVATRTRSSATTGSAENGPGSAVAIASGRWRSPRVDFAGGIAVRRGGQDTSLPGSAVAPRAGRRRRRRKGSSRRISPRAPCLRRRPTRRGAAGRRQRLPAGRLRRGRGELALRQQRRGGRLALGELSAGSALATQRTAACSATAMSITAVVGSSSRQRSG